MMIGSERTWFRGVAQLLLAVGHGCAVPNRVPVAMISTHPREFGTAQPCPTASATSGASPGCGTFSVTS